AISTRDRKVVRVKWQEELPKGWGAYVAGVLRELWALEVTLPNASARVAVASDVPIGAGLSSSAALTVAAARALGALAPGGAAPQPRQLAGVAYRAEHDHVGVGCGTMDHTIAALARRDHALLFEAASLETRQIPFHARLLLVDSGTRHDLRNSQLAKRRDECDAAVRRLKVELDRKSTRLNSSHEWISYDGLSL